MSKVLYWLSPLPIFELIAKGYQALMAELEKVPGFPAYRAFATTATQRVFAIIRLPADLEGKLEPFLEIAKGRMMDPAIVFAVLASMALLGAYASDLGHLDTAPVIWTALPIVSGFNPYLGLVSGIVFSAFDWVAKLLPFEEVYGANWSDGTQNWVGARIGYLLAYATMLFTGLLPGVLSRVFRWFLGGFLRRVLPRPAIATTAAVVLLVCAVAGIGYVGGSAMAGGLGVLLALGLVRAGGIHVRLHADYPGGQGGGHGGGEPPPGIVGQQGVSGGKPCTFCGTPVPLGAWQCGSCGTATPEAKAYLDRKEARERHLHGSDVIDPWRDALGTLAAIVGATTGIVLSHEFAKQIGNYAAFIALRAEPDIGCRDLSEGNYIHKQQQSPIAGTVAGLAPPGGAAAVSPATPPQPGRPPEGKTEPGPVTYPAAPGTQQGDSAVREVLSDDGKSMRYAPLIYDAQLGGYRDARPGEVDSKGQIFAHGAWQSAGSAAYESRIQREAKQDQARWRQKTANREWDYQKDLDAKAERFTQADKERARRQRQERVDKAKQKALDAKQDAEAANSWGGFLGLVKDNLERDFIGAGEDLRAGAKYAKKSYDATTRFAREHQKELTALGKTALKETVRAGKDFITRPLDIALPTITGTAKDVYKLGKDFTKGVYNHLRDPKKLKKFFYTTSGAKNFVKSVDPDKRLVPRLVNTGIGLFKTGTAGGAAAKGTLRVVGRKVGTTTVGYGAGEKAKGKFARFLQKVGKADPEAVPELLDDFIEEYGVKEGETKVVN